MFTLLGIISLILCIASIALKFVVRTEPGTDASGEDVYGWWFKSPEGVKCLIIND